MLYTKAEIVSRSPLRAGVGVARSPFYDRISTIVFCSASTRMEGMVVLGHVMRVSELFSHLVFRFELHRQSSKHDYKPDSSTGGTGSTSLVWKAGHDFSR